MQWSKIGVVGLLALFTGIGLGACKGKGGSGGGSSSASESSKPATSSSGATASSGSAKPADSAKAEIKAADVFGDDKGPEDGVLTVDLSQAKDDAPALGGVAAPPPPPTGAKLEWLPVGNLVVPNPGWKLEKGNNFGILLPEDKKAMVLFTGFKKNEEALKFVDDLMKKMEMKNLKWKKAKPVTLGPDKVPALFGKGHGTDKKGKGAKLFYALIKNEPLNLLAIGGADDDAGDEGIKRTVGIIGNIKKK